MAEFYCNLKSGLLSTKMFVKQFSGRNPHAFPFLSTLGFVDPVSLEVLISGDTG